MKQNPKSLFKGESSKKSGGSPDVAHIDDSDTGKVSWLQVFVLQKLNKNDMRFSMTIIFSDGFTWLLESSS